MKLSIKVKETCIILIYILIFISAITYMRFTLTQVYSWRLLYLASIMCIILLGIVYKIQRRRLFFDSLRIILAVIVAYELVVSYFSSLFVIPMIFIDVIPWPIIISVYYDYMQNNRLPKCFRWITYLGLSLICIASIPNIVVQYTGSNGGAIFSTYYSFAFLPMLYKVGSKKISISFTVIVGLLMLLSLKRSALVIIVVGVLLYYILNSYIEGGARKKINRAFILMIILLAAIFGGGFIIDKLNLNIIDRMMSIFDDGGSGRDRIWEQVLYYFNASPWSEKLFGHGFHSVFYEIQPLGIARYAHNSFLETLYDYGYVGLGFILLIVLRIVRDTICMVKSKNAKGPIMGFTIIIMLVLGLFSYFFEQSIIILPIAVVWGICLGEYKKDKKMGLV